MFPVLYWRKENMGPHWSNLLYILRHKWFVFQAALQLGIPFLGLSHDLSKFFPDEWFPYASYFYRNKPKPGPIGYYKPTTTGDDAFDFAWLLHQKRNKHHWQWWVLPEDNGGTKVLRMPDKYRKEMLADWIGAGKASGTPDTFAWYEANKHKMQLHPETRSWIEEKLKARQGRKS